MEYLIGIRERLKPLISRKTDSGRYISKTQALSDEELHPGSRLWLFLLCFSSGVIITKYLNDYGFNIIFAYKNVLDADFSIMQPLYHFVPIIFWYACAVVSRFQWILIPCIFSAAFITFSWMVLYKDSDIPGVNPATPFSPRKFRSQSERSMDFSYALTGTFGILIFFRMLYQSLKDSD